MKQLLFLTIFYLFYFSTNGQQKYTEEGNDYYQKGKYEEAIKAYTKAKNGFEKTKKNDPVSYATACYNLANAYFSLANYEEAKKLYIESGVIYQKELGENHAYYGAVCNALGSLSSYQNKYEEAFSWYQKAEFILKDLPNEATNYAYTCNGLAGLFGTNLNEKIKDYQKAEHYYLLSQELYKKSIGTENINYAWVLLALSRLYDIQGKYQQSEKLVKEAINIYEKTVGKEHHLYAMSSHFMGTIYLLQNKYELSEKYFLETKNIYTNTVGTSNYNYLENLNILGELYVKWGKYIQAEKYFLESQHISQTTKQMYNVNYINNCTGLANLYFLEGKYNEAEKLLLESQKIIKIVFQSIDNDYWTTNLNNLALLYQTQKNYQKAEELYLQSETIILKIAGDKIPIYATSLNNLGLFYHDIKNYEKSLLYYEKSKKIILTYEEKENTDYARVCHNMAGVYEELKNYKKAEELYLEAKNIYENLLGKEHPNYARTCHHLAVCYKKQQKYAEAELLYSVALKNKLTEIHTLLPTLSERERLAYFQSIHFYFDTFYDFVSKYPKSNLINDLFDIQLEIKGLIFQSTQQMQNQVLKSNNSALIENYFTWKEEKALYNSYRLMSVEEREKNKINLDSLDKVVNEKEKMLSKQSILFSKNNHIYTWKDIQNKLAINETAIDIIRTDSVYLALILQKTGNPQLIFIDSTQNIERQIHYYRNCIKYELEDSLSYQVFWKPIKEKLKNTQKVFFANDGSFHEINLSTLKNPATKKFLLEEANIQLVSNLKDLMYLSEIEQNEKYTNYKIHVIAYPQYKNEEISPTNDYNLHEKLKSDTTQRFFEKGNSISMLPGTHLEAQKIAQLCDSLKIVVEVKELKSASEEYIKSLKSPSILHIATHGFFLSNENENNYTDPLLRSGLLLANAEQGIQGAIKEGQEDGILTAKEALTLQLDETNLVIMSACETGLGDIKYGEGVYGLQRAFQQAGAKTIIISLWKVSDDATQELMTLFYHNLLEKKMDKRTAFEQAQLSLMKKYHHPFYWGAFVMIGK